MKPTTRWQTYLKQGDIIRIGDVTVYVLSGAKGKGAQLVVLAPQEMPIKKLNKQLHKYAEYAMGEVRGEEM